MADVSELSGRGEIMTWRVRHTRTFYKELARLPAEVRRGVEEVAFGEAITEDPFLGRISITNWRFCSTLRPAHATASVPTPSNTSAWSNDICHEFHKLPRKREK